VSHSTASRSRSWSGTRRPLRTGSPTKTRTDSRADVRLINVLCAQKAKGSAASDKGSLRLRPWLRHHRESKRVLRGLHAPRVSWRRVGRQWVEAEGVARSSLRQRKRRGGAAGKGEQSNCQWRRRCWGPITGRREVSRGEERVGGSIERWLLHQRKRGASKWRSCTAARAAWL